MQLQNFFAQATNGNILPGATCTVYLADTLTLATGLEDRNGSPITNPFFADARGLAQFAAPDGSYDIRITLGSLDGTLRAVFFDGQDFKDDLASASDPDKGDALIGHYDPIAPTFLKTTSDILNMEPIDARRGLPKSDWAAIDAGTTTRDASADIQELIDAINAAGGGRLMMPRMVRASGLILKSRVKLEGLGKGMSTIKAPNGWTAGNVMESFDFDTYKSAPTDTNTPVEIGLINLMIDGNFENYAGTASDVAGMCLRLASHHAEMKSVRIMGAPGVGMHTALGTVSRPSVDWFRFETPSFFFTDIEVFGNKNDGWVFDGPADALIQKVELGVNGWPDNVGFTASRPSLIEPSRRVANLVINKAAEIGWVHSFGCREGWGVIGGRPSYGSGTIRIKWDTMISESSNGGVWMRDGALYQGAVLDVHNCYGNDGAEYFRDDGANLQGHIALAQIFGNSTNDSGQSKVFLGGSRKTINSLVIDGANGSGHGLVMDGFANRVDSGSIIRCIGTSQDTTGANGVLIKATASAPYVKADVSACLTGAKMESGAANVSGEIRTAFGNTTNFTGFDNLALTDRRHLTLKDSSSPDFRTNKIIAVSADIPADATTLKTISIPIKGVYTPNIGEIQLTVQFVSGTAPDVTQLSVAPGSLSQNNVTAFIKFAAVGSGVVRINLSVP